MQHTRVPLSGLLRLYQSSCHWGHWEHWDSCTKRGGQRKRTRQMHAHSWRYEHEHDDAVVIWPLRLLRLDRLHDVVLEDLLLRLLDSG